MGENLDIRHHSNVEEKRKIRIDAKEMWRRIAKIDTTAGGGELDIRHHSNVEENLE